VNTRAYRLIALLAVAAALALPAAALAVTHDGVDRGVVQSVDATHIVVRALDGSVVTFDLSPRLVVRLNAGPASIAAITPGVVADISLDAKGRAAMIRAFQPTITERGVITAVSKTSLTFAGPAGIRTVVLDANTRFKVVGGPSRRAAVKVGAAVAVTRVPDGPAQIVNVLKRAGA